MKFLYSIFRTFFVYLCFCFPLLMSANEVNALNDLSNRLTSSSSASFTTGIGYGITYLLNRTVEKTELALACKRVENEFIGINSGIMDQFIICNGVENGALLLDCNTLEYETIPFELEDNVLIVAGTNKTNNAIQQNGNSFLYKAFIFSPFVIDEV